MDNYEIVKEIGKGGSATCYLVKQKITGDEYVCKKSDTTSEGLNQKDIEKYYMELDIMERLNHPNIIKLIESFVEEERKYMILEYASYGTLDVYINEHFPLTEDIIGSYISQIVYGLQYLHEIHVLHRDMKTSNIFVFAPDAQIVKIADFGISKILDPANLTATMVGTPFYLAPEMCSNQSYGYPSDMWSLGCLIYEILEGHRAFESNNLAEILGSVCSGSYSEMKLKHYNPQWRAIVESLLQVDPTDRPSINELCNNPLILKYHNKESNLSNSSTKINSRSSSRRTSVVSMSNNNNNTGNGSNNFQMLIPTTSSLKSPPTLDGSGHWNSPSSTPGNGNGRKRFSFQDDGCSPSFTIRKNMKSSINESTVLITIHNILDEITQHHNTYGVISNPDVKQKLEDAITVINSVISCKTGQSLEGIGDCYYEIGEFELANDFYEEATHCKRGGASIDVMEKKGRTVAQHAISLYKDLVDPKNVNVILSDSVIEGIHDRISSGIDTLSRLVQLSTSPKRLYLLGNVYFKRAYLGTETFIADLNSAKESFKAADQLETESGGFNPQHLINYLLLEVLDDAQVELFNQAIICKERCLDYSSHAEEDEEYTSFIDCNNMVFSNLLFILFTANKNISLTIERQYRNISIDEFSNDLINMLHEPTLTRNDYTILLSYIPLLTQIAFNKLQCKLFAKNFRYLQTQYQMLNSILGNLLVAFQENMRCNRNPNNYDDQVIISEKDYHWFQYVYNLKDCKDSCDTIVSSPESTINRKLTNLSSDTGVDINEVIISSTQQAKRRLKEHVGMRKNTTGHPVPLDVLQRLNSNFQRQNNISEDDSSDTINSYSFGSNRFNKSHSMFAPLIQSTKSSTTTFLTNEENRLDITPNNNNVNNNMVIPPLNPVLHDYQGGDIRLVRKSMTRRASSSISRNNSVKSESTHSSPSGINRSLHDELTVSPITPPITKKLFHTPPSPQKHDFTPLIQSPLSSSDVVMPPIPEEVQSQEKLKQEKLLQQQQQQQDNQLNSQENNSIQLKDKQQQERKDEKTQSLHNSDNTVVMSEKENKEDKFPTPPTSPNSTNTRGKENIVVSQRHCCNLL